MILFVDDERRYILEYKTAMEEAGYKVEYRKDVVVAFNYLKEHLPQIELLILDIMMPPGELLGNTDTQGGLRTGVKLFELIREIDPSLPILILTNVSDILTENYFHEQPHCEFIRKEYCDPLELTERVNRFLTVEGLFLGFNSRTEFTQ